MGTVTGTIGTLYMNRFVIGSYYADGSNIIGGAYFNGLLDQPTVWNRVLTTTEITQLYNSGNGLNYTKWNAALKTDLVSIWKFDEESSSTVVYDEHGDNNGTNVGATVNQTGKVGKCYTYVNNSKITIPNNSNFDFNAASESFTYCIWVKSSNPSIYDSSSKLFTWAGAGAYCIDVGATSTALSFVMYDGTNVPVVSTTDAANDVWDGNWHFVACVNSVVDDKMYLYIDGVLDNSVANTIVRDTKNTADFTIGNYPTLTRSYSGLLDELMVYSKALTEDNITWLYNNGDGRSYSEL